MKKFDKVLKDCLHNVEKNTMKLWAFAYEC